MDKVRAYYYLTKPGIIYGNLLTAAAGFLLAANWHIDFGLFLALLVGTSLVIAAACVTNNYIDRGIDAKMARTQRRALVKGSISGQAALSYAAVLGILGAGILAAYTNALTLTIGIIAFVDYVVLYGLSKRHSVHGTLVGSISGSAPIVAGYTAVTGRLDGGALILFLILTFWQMPHFYAIALYRFKDYKAAGLPVLPVVKGVDITKRQSVAYIVAFTAAVIALTAFGYTGYLYAIVMGGIGLWWLRLALRPDKDSAHWGRQLFLFSLIVILATSVMTAVGGRLP